MLKLEFIFFINTVLNKILKLNLPVSFKTWLVENLKFHMWLVLHFYSQPF